MTFKPGFLTLAIFFVGTLIDLAKAAEFKIVDWHLGPAIEMSGPITSGDAQRFEEAYSKAQPYAHGVPVMLLRSPGGSVSAAFAISEAMDTNPVHTVVPNDAECASACASIVFVAGKYRTMQTFGRFGQHSCSIGGVPDPDCNEVISKHALAHGISHGSIAAFVTQTPPSDIQWFSKHDLDGWGISRYPGSKAVGFEKSEPIVIEILSGRSEPPQEVWRLDFFGPGWRAFYRPIRDDKREYQISQFCFEDGSGQLLLSIEVPGPSGVIETAIRRVRLQTKEFSIATKHPVVKQLDHLVSLIMITIPRQHVLTWLTKSSSFQLLVETTKEYEPIVVQGRLAGSRKNLIFAANNCVR